VLPQNSLEEAKANQEKQKHDISFVRKKHAKMHKESPFEPRFVKHLKRVEKEDLFR
jgi:hypothetical protein